MNLDLPHTIPGLVSCLLDSSFQFGCDLAMDMESDLCFYSAFGISYDNTPISECECFLLMPDVFWGLSPNLTWSNLTLDSELTHLLQCPAENSQAMDSENRLPKFCHLF